MTDLSYSAGSERCHGPQHQYVLSWGRDEQGQPQRWRVEQEKPQDTAIFVDANTLEIDSAAGLTMWLNKPLSGTYRISFTREVMMQNRPHDRLSDVNLFWAARDPANPDLFTRDGELSQYDALELYYAGIGGNWNTTSRFRRYDGRGKRQLLEEFTDASRLLRPHHAYHMVIEVANNATRLWVDGELWFSAAYTSPPAPGYFAFRTVWSRQVIRNFRVTPL